MSEAVGIAIIVSYAKNQSKLEAHFNSSPTYSIDGVQTYYFDLACQNPKFHYIDPEIKEKYCAKISSSFHAALKERFPSWQESDNNSDIKIYVEFEGAWASNPHSRKPFVQPVVFIQIIRWGTVIAEYRSKNFITYGPIFWTMRADITHEQALMKYADDVVEEIIVFIEEPLSVEPVNWEEVEASGY